jgi:hypothetical protein
VQQNDQFIVTIVQKPAKEMTILDLFLGSASLMLLAVLLGVLLGGLLGLVLVRWHRRHRPEDDHLPSISPFAPESNRPRSSPTR